MDENSVKKLRFIFLYPLSILYGMLTRVRNLLYDSAIFKSVQFDQIKTIGLGNLCVGGSGKTPHTEMIIKMLKGTHKIAYLSRGYGRNTSGFLEVFEDSKPENTGDESLQVKRKFQELFVSVCENRVKGIQMILEKAPETELVILDDAFQHRKLKCGLTILLTEYNDLYLHDYLMPAGRLREGKGGYLRADLIVVTKTPESATAIDLRKISKEIQPRAYQKLFFSYLQYGKMYSMMDSSVIFPAEQKLFLFRVLLVTGIAKPEALVTWVKEYADDVIHRSYPDHHNFTPADIHSLIREFQSVESENKIMVTTEKDAIRLRTYQELLNEIPIFVVPIEVDFQSQAKEMEQCIKQFLKQKKIQHDKYYK